MRMRFSYSYEEFPAALFLTVRVSPRGKRNANFRECKAKIDTGASLTVIPEELQKELRLPPREPVRVRSAFDAEGKIRPTFSVILSISHSFSFSLLVLSSPIEYCLIGRDVLNQIILNANGPSEFFELTTEAN